MFCLYTCLRICSVSRDGQKTMKNLNTIKSLRVLRVLRPLKTINRVPKLKVSQLTKHFLDFFVMFLANVSKWKSFDVWEHEDAEACDGWNLKYVWNWQNYLETKSELVIFKSVLSTFRFWELFEGFGVNLRFSWRNPQRFSSIFLVFRYFSGCLRLRCQLRQKRVQHPHCLRPVPIHLRCHCCPVVPGKIFLLQRCVENDERPMSVSLVFILYSKRQSELKKWNWMQCVINLSLCHFSIKRDSAEAWSDDYWRLLHVSI